MPFDLIKEFNSVSELKKQDYDNDVNILMGGDGVTNRMSLQAVLALNHVSIEKKREEFIQFILELTYQQIIENIREAQIQISDAVNRMADVINKTDEKIMRINKILQDMTRRHQALNDTIEARYFEKDSDNKYRSKSVADTLIAYEQRTGKKITNDITPEILIQILKSQSDFEKDMIVPALENDLVKLHTFRDGVEANKENFEEENNRIDNAIEAIDADDSLSDEERRFRKAELLEQVSETALDAQMAAHSAEAEYVELATELQEEKWNNNNNLYMEHANEELNQSALDNLQTIKPILVP